MGLFKKEQLEHLGYGTVNGMDGKPFKTRDGKAPKLEALFDEVKNIDIFDYDYVDNPTEEANVTEEPQEESKKDKVHSLKEVE